MKRRPITLVICLCIVPACHVVAAPVNETARELLKASGVNGGLIVHLNCGDGELTTALRATDAYLVHGLDRDPANVTKARERVLATGKYGKVTIDRWHGPALPYIDNLANLIVVSGDEARVSKEELMRVLAPGGVALAPPSSSLAPLRKPWPTDIDEWTHYLHDADNNAVANDKVVGPPRHYQWLGSPRYLRHHDHLSGLSAMVSAKGRIFYIMDLGPRWSVQMPPKWTLIARDAFNGTVLWQRPIRKWHAHLWPLKRGPAQLMRRLVAVGDVVYVTMGVGEPLVALDAAMGKTLRTYKGTEGTEELILADGVLYLLVNPERDAYKALPRESVGVLRGAGARWNWDERPRQIMAVDAATGRTRWSRESVVAPCTLAAAAGRVYFHDGDRVLCLAAEDGRDVWASKPIPRWKPMHVLFGPTLVVHKHVVLFAGGEKMDQHRGGKDTMTALDAKTGEKLWTAPHPESGYASSEDLFVIDGLAWCGMTTNTRYSGVFTGRDLHTGAVVSEFPPDDWQPHMPHHRCHRAKATVNYILPSRTGIEFVDFRAKHWIPHHWVRGSCNYGIMPCNGLVYAPPHSCACYLLAKLTGLNALAPGGQRSAVRSQRSGKLERGPAYEGSIQRPEPSAQDPETWPTYRGNAARSGSTSAAVSAELALSWTADIGGKLSAPVVAEGKLIVSAVETHTIHALDASTGERAWSFTAGGRVDSPPTIWQGRVLFGSNDGCVYCLRVRDGVLAWRFRAARMDQRMVAHEQVESVWPVHGSVLVREGQVYAVAGRAMWLDGGLRMLRLDAETGRQLSETVLGDTYPDTDDNLQRDLQWPNLPVSLPDVLSCDGRHIYMRSQPFSLDGKRTEVVTPRRYNEQHGDTAHLFCPTGLLDDSWWHRTYYMYGRSYISAAGGWYLATYQAPAGRILSVDGSTVYGFGRAPMRFGGTPVSYHLFACHKEPELINPNPKRPPRKRGSRIYGLVVPTRLKYHWSKSLPIMVRALVVAGDTVFAAGPPAVVDETEVYDSYGKPETQEKLAEHVAAFEGRKGGIVVAVSKAGGEKVTAFRLAHAPVFNGLAAAQGRLFMATLNGKVVCLGPKGEALSPAPEVKLGPVSAAPRRLGGTRAIVPTKSHPDFQHLSRINVSKSDLCYRMETSPRETGLALRKLTAPLTKRASFRVKIRPRPGAPKGTPGNGFLALGSAPDDAQLIKCGFRISGQRLYIVQGTGAKGKTTATPVKVAANEVVELEATVDLAGQKITTTMSGKTVEAPIADRLDAITWIGYWISSVDADFGPIEVSGE